MFQIHSFVKNRAKIQKPIEAIQLDGFLFHNISFFRFHFLVIQQSTAHTLLIFSLLGT
jgi:hypothetical protein